MAARPAERLDEREALPRARVDPGHRAGRNGAHVERVLPTRFDPLGPPPVRELRSRPESCLPPRRRRRRPGRRRRTTAVKPDRFIVCSSWLREVSPATYRTTTPETVHGRTGWAPDSRDGGSGFRETCEIWLSQAPSDASASATQIWLPGSAPAFALVVTNSVMSGQSVQRSGASFQGKWPVPRSPRASRSLRISRQRSPERGTGVPGRARRRRPASGNRARELVDDVERAEELPSVSVQFGVPDPAGKLSSPGTCGPNTAKTRLHSSSDTERRNRSARPAPRRPRPRPAEVLY